MARLRDVVFDCAHPASLARFWAAALDGHSVAPYDDDEIARLRALGIDDVEDDPAVLVEAGPTQPRLWFQRVHEQKTVKNRVHLDLACDDVEAEVARLVGLGAAVAVRPEGDDPVAMRDPDGSVTEGGIKWVVLQDPEGNEFCVHPSRPAGDCSPNVGST